MSKRQAYGPLQKPAIQGPATWLLGPRPPHGSPKDAQAFRVPQGPPFPQASQPMPAEQALTSCPCRPSGTHTPRRSPLAR